MFSRPLISLFKLILVINILLDTAQDLHFIHGFHSHSQIFLDKCRINNGSTNTHTDRTDLQIGFSSHGSHGHGCSAETQQLLLHIFRNLDSICFLYIMSIDAKRRQSLLGMCCQYGCKVYGTGSLRTVKSPDTLNRVRRHIHGFRTVAPAGGHGQSNGNAFRFKKVRTFCRFCHASDGGR